MTEEKTEIPRKGLLRTLDESIYKLHFRFAEAYQNQTGENKDNLTKLAYFASMVTFSANAVTYNSLISAFLGFSSGFDFLYNLKPKNQEIRRRIAKRLGPLWVLFNTCGIISTAWGATQVVEGVKNHNLESISNGINFLQFGAGITLSQVGDYLNRVDLAPVKPEPINNLGEN